MSYSKNYDCIRNMFWDGGGLSLDRTGIEESLRRALHDYTSRTQAKVIGNGDASVSNLFEALGKDFVDEFLKYFSSDNKNQSEYDKWHHDMCNLFIEKIQGAKIKASETYGKAQKIVNMTIKTIYCLEGARKKEEDGYFDYCHMPLDSITIEWFRNRLAEKWYNNGRPRSQRIKISLNGGPLPKWSNLSFSEESLSYTYSQYDDNATLRLDSKSQKYHYMFFVSMIREYFKSGNTSNNYDGLTPFQAEFYIWPEMQYEISAQNLLDQDLPSKLSSNIGVTVDNLAIKNMLDKLSNQLSDMSKFY